MESRWYLNPGQTLETTRIEDRGHALHATKDAWGNVTAHLDRRRLKQEAIDREQAKRQALKEGSAEMTKNWDNSVENVRIRKEEERLKKIESIQEKRMKNFYILRKEQADIKAKYIEDVRKTMYRSQGHPKCLTGALIEGEVYYEREKQLEMKNMIQKHEEAVEAKYAQKVKADAQQEKEENMNKENKVREKNIMFQSLLLNDIKERADNERNVKATSKANEIQDNKNADKENAKIAAILLQEELNKRANIKQELQDFRKQQERLKELKLQEERETDLVLDIYFKAKQKIVCMRKRKEDEMRKEAQRKADIAAKKLLMISQAKSNVEDQIMQKAIDERDKAEKEMLQAKAEYHSQLVKDRKQNYEDYLKREAHRKYVKEQQTKWEMLNRFKTDEVMTKYEQDKKQKNWEKILAYRKELFDAMDINRQIEKQKQDEIDAIYKEDMEKLANEDKNFFEYANEVLKYAEEKGWSTMPIMKVIRTYKKENSLPLNYVHQCENYESVPKYGMVNKYFH